ncbi:two-component system, OmpR family, alkaline phosphatase synthesis response regulator PhoP [Thalassobacillus cyri]|uniref:Two-component system, OmpR family, alkaline phosphatase synthesis response regulator PhoP n=1 Tax=Thalassobacillus cyri TaxID=571932 RepID=A0A1H3X5C2_9BACI|nr:two-component system, OmpR family, alkaline phosphatase synthesis response regulator PhoP [Thalassobacillus cyri]
MIKQKILVVEDDPMIMDLVAIYLEKAGYDVVKAEDGEKAKDMYYSHDPCLIILDLMLPKVSGEAFCRWVKSQAPREVSIIMLSAKARTEDKIAGLKMGADDYITKPFSPEELVAHVEAVLRRTGQHCQKITFKGLSIKPRKGEVTLNGEPLNLTNYEFNLLYVFMENPNIVLSREHLLNHINPYEENDIFERTIDVHVKKLRRKIEENPAKPERIITVRGMGYKFVAEN